MVTKLIDAGVTSLANMAFFTTYQPGAHDDAPLVQSITKALNLDPVPGNVLIAIRRLHYESHAMYVADLKLKVSATEEDLPKKMPTAERAARHAEQKVRLKGVIIEGEFECSHTLLDAVAQQFERDELKYVPVSSCTTREQELVGVRKESQLSLDSEGQLKIKPSTSLAVADNGTDLKLKNSLTRRGLAYDQAGLLDFLVHAKWVEKLFATQARSSPPGYRPISINQMLEADRALWKKMADHCRSGIVPTPGGPRPLDEALEKFMDCSEVVYFLLPLPGSSSQAESSSSFGPARDRRHDNRSGPKGGKGGSKGKSKSSSKGPGLNLEALGWPPGVTPKLKDGRHLCFNFNGRSGCKFAKPGGRCRAGFHYCARNGCEGKHSATSCSGKMGAN